MKTSTRIFTCLLLLFTATSQVKAQQQPVPANAVKIQPPTQGLPQGYTYSIFQAPNKMYGYNIFSNGRIVFRQAAAAQSRDKKPSLDSPGDTEKAAAFSIEKLKKGRQPELSPEEIVSLKNPKKPIR